MNQPTDHFTASDEPEIARIEASRYLSVRGDGRPGTGAFYARKSLAEGAARELRRVRPDAAWMPEDSTEIAYWYDEEIHGHVGIADFYSAAPLEHLHFRVLVQVPDDVTSDDLATARRNLDVPARTAGTEPELWSTAGGTVVQVTHHGPFAEEYDTLRRLGEFADRNGLKRSGPHHEIHLDPFSEGSPQEGLRTILRDWVAVAPAG
ncbi:hypothetical protein GCM10027445_30610 [Amycolatopsis endophytica]